MHNPAALRQLQSREILELASAIFPEMTEQFFDLLRRNDSSAMDSRLNTPKRKSSRGQRDMTEMSPSFLSFIARRLFVKGSLLQWYRPFICPLDELIARVPVGSHVLDVGCGRGLFLGLLRATGRIEFGYGFDSSPEAITIARRMAAPGGRSVASGGSLIFEHRSVADPWPGGQFDVVSIVDVMHHVPPALQRKLLELAISRIKPGGLLLYKDMACRPQWRAMANRLHDLLLARQRIHYAPITEIQGWATDAGLELVEALTINRLWYGHELCVFRRPSSSFSGS